MNRTHVYKFLYSVNAEFFLKTVGILLPRKIVTKLDSFQESVDRLKKYMCVMPEEDDEFMENLRHFWTDERIYNAQEQLKSGFVRNKSFYDTILMSASELSIHENILDFGCGIGIQAQEIKKRYPEKNVYGYDISFKASPLLFNQLVDSKKIDDFGIIDSFEDVLANTDLVYSNLVFSHFSENHINNYLSIFKRNNCALLVSSNTHIEQNKSKIFTEIRDYEKKLFSHNYIAYLSKHNFEVKWIYQLKNILNTGKNIVFFYAV